MLIIFFDIKEKTKQTQKQSPPPQNKKTNKTKQTTQQQGQKHTYNAKDYTATTKILLQH